MPLPARGPLQMPGALKPNVVEAHAMELIKSMLYLADTTGQSLCPIADKGSLGVHCGREGVHDQIRPREAVNSCHGRRDEVCTCTRSLRLHKSLLHRHVLFSTFLALPLPLLPPSPSLSLSRRSTPQSPGCGLSSHVLTSTWLELYLTILLKESIASMLVDPVV